MRPQGDIRRALRSAAEALAEAQGGGTLREIALQACVSCPEGDEWGPAGERRGVPMPAASATVKNMLRAGELVRVGSAKEPSSARWVAIYAPGCAA